MAKEMIRFCVVCGKKLKIKLNDKGEIISGGGYWSFEGSKVDNLFKKQGSNFNPKTIDEQTEYWECEKCMEADP